MVIAVLRMLGSLLEPSALLCLVIIASAIAAVTRRRRLMLALQGIAVAIVVALGVLPGGTWLALPLEKYFPGHPLLPDQIAGIIALGGTERLAQSEAWGRPVLSDTAPIAALLALGRRYPDARLVFTGGSPPGHRTALTESQVVRDFIAEMGLDGGRLIYEERARNTLENAVFTRDLMAPKADERWVLVGQAISLPRAVAVFRHAGWNVIPYPAGYLTEGEPGMPTRLHLRDGLSTASVALHEWGGLLVYRLLGYTDVFFPE